MNLVLKWILEKRGVKLWSGFHWTFSGAVMNRGVYKIMEYIDQLGNYQFFNELHVEEVDYFFCTCE
jgi:hypothetical protein